MRSTAVMPGDLLEDGATVDEHLAVVLPIVLRPATPDDRLFVEHLHGAAYHDVVVEQFGAWDEQRQQDFFDEKWQSQSFEIVLVGGVAVGAVSVSIAADHVQLNEMLVLPEHQGQGIGTVLLERVKANAEALGLPVRLRVLHRNRARQLYERHGFEVYGETKTHFLMRLRAPGDGR